MTSHRRGLSLLERQPVAFRAAAVAAVTAVVHVAVVYGLLDSEQEKAIGAAIDAVGGLVAVLWAIQVVTPNAKVVTRVTTDGSVVTGGASTVPEGTEIGVAPGGTLLGEPGSPPSATAPVKQRLVSTPGE